MVDNHERSLFSKRTNFTIMPDHEVESQDSLALTNPRNNNTS